MKIALSVYKGGISTVFDAADQLLIVEPAGGKAIPRVPYRFLAADPVHRAAEMKDQKIEILICGAISRAMEASIAAQGIEVYPFVRGTVDEVIEAYRDDRLGQAVFILPGCRRRGNGGNCRHRGVNCRRK